MAKLDITKIIPSGAFGKILDFAFMLIIILVVGGCIAGIIYFVFHKSKFNIKVVLFKNIEGVIRRTAIYKSAFVPIGQAGDKICFVQKLKKYVAYPTIASGHNEYWYFERSDGEWINFGLKDLDEEMKRAGATYVDFDMRMQRVAIQKNLQERLQKKGIWEQYGTVIMSVVYIIVTSIGLVMVFREQRKGYVSAREMAEAVREMAEAVNNLRPGVVPASIFAFFKRNWFGWGKK